MNACGRLTLQNAVLNLKKISAPLPVVVNRIEMILEKNLSSGCTNIGNRHGGKKREAQQSRNNFLHSFILLIFIFEIPQISSAVSLTQNNRNCNTFLTICIGCLANFYKNRTTDPPRVKKTNQNTRKRFTIQQNVFVSYVDAAVLIIIFSVSRLRGSQRHHFTKCTEVRTDG